MTEFTEPNIESEHTFMSRKNSKTSDAPSSDSKPHWDSPRNIKQFAIQANKVATMVLNGDIDMETARTFATLARVVAQATSIEVTKARFLKESPDLELEDE